MTTVDKLVTTRNLTKEFGKVIAVDGISIQIDSGEFVSIVGPNGAGKTTFFNMMTGDLAPSGGKIRFRSDEVTGLPPQEMVQKGLARSFQNTNVFSELSVRENVRAAVQRRDEWYNFWRHKSSFQKTTARVDEILAMLNLEEHADDNASELSHADQRLLEVGIAIATEPAMLLLDEPTAGMTSDQAGEFMRTFDEEIRPRLEGVLMIEHNIEAVMDYSDRVVVMHNGNVIMKGPPEDVHDNQQVRRVYLGER
jgi:branched-chain amino acid transport system ATP-binding protein